jgi:hypothetical protein
VRSSALAGLVQAYWRGVDRGLPPGGVPGLSPIYGAGLYALEGEGSFYAFAVPVSLQVYLAAGKRTVWLGGRTASLGR